MGDRRHRARRNAGTHQRCHGFDRIMLTVIIVRRFGPFAGFTEAHGEEIWFSDGTEEGTGMLEEIAAGDDGNINPLTLTPSVCSLKQQSSIGHEPHWFNGDSIETSETSVPTALTTPTVLLLWATRPATPPKTIQTAKRCSAPTPRPTKRRCSKTSRLRAKTAPEYPGINGRSLYFYAQEGGAKTIRCGRRTALKGPPGF